MEIVVAIIAALFFVIGFFYFRSSYQNLKKSQEHLRKEFEKLKFRNTDLETHQLKFSMQPHTLKNVLGNIQAMSNRISESMGSLSSILDYIIYHGEEHYTTVESEVEFIKNYVTLQNAFMKVIKNTKIDINLVNENNPHYSEKAIPHLITAYLIENAYKHGDSDHPEFLKISILLEDHNFEIEVRNKVRNNYNSTKVGIGLTNMKSRLRHLKDGKYRFEAALVDDEYVANLKINLK